MSIRIINSIEVTVTGTISDDELSVYLTQLQAKQKRKIIKADISVDNEYIDVNYTFEYMPFERIRRITGYLVGTTERWGDAKQAELRDRKTHTN
ncbi:anaerobic ribonucleoside-triphosphate reductase [Pelosinus sp. sgz500959]|uniref:anaerobic ribonucleoside-triphosphate reductase n=1 Tax=Pelosinus sp. sgz500959 TaxID=3242472 RepID=UPI0036718693